MRIDFQDKTSKQLQGNSASYVKSHSDPGTYRRLLEGYIAMVEMMRLRARQGRRIYEIDNSNDLCKPLAIPPERKNEYVADRAKGDSDKEEYYSHVYDIVREYFPLLYTALPEQGYSTSYIDYGDMKTWYAGLMYPNLFGIMAGYVGDIDSYISPGARAGVSQESKTYRSLVWPGVVVAQGSILDGTELRQGSRVGEGSVVYNVTGRLELAANRLITIVPVKVDGVGKLAILYTAREDNLKVSLKKGELLGSNAYELINSWRDAEGNQLFSDLDPGIDLAEARIWPVVDADEIDMRMVEWMALGQPAPEGYLTAGKVSFDDMTDKTDYPAVLDREERLREKIETEKARVSGVKEYPWYEEYATRASVDRPDTIIEAVIFGLGEDGYIDADTDLPLLSIVAERVIRGHLEQHLDSEEDKINDFDWTLKRLELQCILAYRLLEHYRQLKEEEVSVCVLVYEPYIGLLPDMDETKVTNTNMDINEILIILSHGIRYISSNVIREAGNAITSAGGYVTEHWHTSLNLETSLKQSTSVDIYCYEVNRIPGSSVPEGFPLDTRRLVGQEVASLLVGLSEINAHRLCLHLVNPQELLKTQPGEFPAYPVYPSDGGYNNYTAQHSREQLRKYHTDGIVMRPPSASENTLIQPAIDTALRFLRREGNPNAVRGPPRVIIIECPTVTFAAYYDVNRHILYIEKPLLANPEYDLNRVFVHELNSGTHQENRSAEERYHNRRITLDDLKEKRIAFYMLKPDGVQYETEILQDLEDNCFECISIIRRQDGLSPAEAGVHYIEYREKQFFEALVAYVSSGPVTLVILRGDNYACDRLRDLVGKYDGSEPGTLRYKYGIERKIFNVVVDGQPQEVGVVLNKIHSSDSPERTLTEISLLHSRAELQGIFTVDALAFAFGFMETGEETTPFTNGIGLRFIPQEQEEVRMQISQARAEGRGFLVKGDISGWQEAAIERKVRIERAVEIINALYGSNPEITLPELGVIDWVDAVNMANVVVIQTKARSPPFFYYRNSFLAYPFLFLSRLLYFLPLVSSLILVVIYRLSLIQIVHAGVVGNTIYISNYLFDFLSQRELAALIAHRGVELAAKQKCISQNIQWTNALALRIDKIAGQAEKGIAWTGNSCVGSRLGERVNVLNLNYIKVIRDRQQRIARAIRLTNNLSVELPCNLGIIDIYNTVRTACIQSILAQPGSRSIKSYVGAQDNNIYLVTRSMNGVSDLELLQALIEGAIQLVVAQRVTSGGEELSDAMIDDFIA